MDFEDIRNMKDLQKAIAPTKKETAKIFDACAGLAEMESQRHILCRDLETN